MTVKTSKEKLKSIAFKIPLIETSEKLDKSWRPRVELVNKELRRFTVSFWRSTSVCRESLVSWRTSRARLRLSFTRC